MKYEVYCYNHCRDVPKPALLFLLDEIFFNCFFCFKITKSFVLLSFLAYKVYLFMNIYEDVQQFHHANDILFLYIVNMFSDMKKYLPRRT